MGNGSGHCSVWMPFHSKWMIKEKQRRDHVNIMHTSLSSPPNTSRVQYNIGTSKNRISSVLDPETNHCSFPSLQRVSSHPIHHQIKMSRNATPQPPSSLSEMILTSCKGKGFPLPREIRVHVVRQQHRSPVANFASAISLTAHRLLLVSLIPLGFPANKLVWSLRERA